MRANRFFFGVVNGNWQVRACAAPDATEAGYYLAQFITKPFKVQEVSRAAAHKWASKGTRFTSVLTGRPAKV